MSQNALIVNPKPASKTDQNKAVAPAVSHIFAFAHLSGE